MKVAIIGAGLAGLAVARALSRAGHEATVYDGAGDIAQGASGNEIGLYNPRFTAEKTPQAQFYADAFFHALEIFKTTPGIDWNPCGALHLVNDEKKARRFPQTLKNWGWGAGDMQMLKPHEATSVAGVEIDKPALYLPRSGFVSPRKLCAALAVGLDIHLNTRIENLESIKADAVVLACANACRLFAPARDLDLRHVRGQISFFEATAQSAALRCTLGYSGYMAPALEGVHCIGSTFQPWLQHSDIIPADDADNLQKMMLNIPALRSDYVFRAHRASVRSTTPDHFPMIGRLGAGVYITAGHGSHGILSGLYGAEILAAQIMGQSVPCAPGVEIDLTPRLFTKS